VATVLSHESPASIICSQIHLRKVVRLIRIAEIAHVETQAATLTSFIELVLGIPFTLVFIPIEF
jgi:hypothetical protein